MMAAIQLIAFFAVVVATAAETITLAREDESLVKMKPDVEIINKPIETYKNNGVIKGMRPCGGNSKAIQWRYESCLETDDICRNPTDGMLRTFQLDFEPSHDIEPLVGVRFNLKSTDGTIDAVYDYGSVKAEKVLTTGNIYTISGEASASDKLKGKRLVVQFIVYNVNDTEHVEVCTESDFEYY